MNKILMQKDRDCMEITNELPYDSMHNYYLLCNDREEYASILVTKQDLITIRDNLDEFIKEMSHET